MRAMKASASGFGATIFEMMLPPIPSLSFMYSR
jgi:hypothetical protein